MPTEDLAHRGDRLGEVGLALQRALSRGLGPGIGILGCHPVVGQVAPAVRDPGVGLGVPRVERQGVLEKVERSYGALPR